MNDAELATVAWIAGRSVEVDEDERRAELREALEMLRTGAEELLANADRAWLAFACALLADELSE